MNGMILVVFYMFVFVEYLENIVETIDMFEGYERNFGMY